MRFKASNIQNFLVRTRCIGAFGKPLAVIHIRRRKMLSWLSSCAAHAACQPEFSSKRLESTGIPGYAWILFQPQKGRIFGLGAHMYEPNFDFDLSLIEHSTYNIPKKIHIKILVAWEAIGTPVYMPFRQTFPALFGWCLYFPILIWNAIKTRFRDFYFSKFSGGCPTDPHGLRSRNWWFEYFDYWPKVPSTTEMDFRDFFRLLLRPGTYDPDAGSRLRRITTAGYADRKDSPIYGCYFSENVGLNEVSIFRYCSEIHHENAFPGLVFFKIYRGLQIRMGLRLRRFAAVGKLMVWIFFVIGLKYHGNGLSGFFSPVVAVGKLFVWMHIIIIGLVWNTMKMRFRASNFQNFLGEGH